MYDASGFKILTQTRDRADVPAPRASTSQMTMEAKTPETIIGSIDMTRAGSGKVHVDIKGRWLGASCAEIKDRD